MTLFSCAWSSDGSNVGSEFGILGAGFLIPSLVLVDEPEFRGIQSSVFQDLVLGSDRSWLNRFEVWAIFSG